MRLFFFGGAERFDFRRPIFLFERFSDLGQI